MCILPMDHGPLKNKIGKNNSPSSKCTQLPITLYPRVRLGLCLSLSCWDLSFLSFVVFANCFNHCKCIYAPVMMHQEDTVSSYSTTTFVTYSLYASPYSMIPVFWEEKTQFRYSV